MTAGELERVETGGGRKGEREDFGLETGDGVKVICGS